MSLFCLPREFADAMREHAGTAHVDLVAWDDLSNRPSRLDEVEFWVPPYRRHGVAPFVAEMRRMTRLRVVQLLTAGFDAWIDSTPPQVVLCNARGLHGASTAEIAVGGIISLLRELPTYLDQQRRGIWHRRDTESLLTKHVVVIGAGDVGDRISRAIEPLGASVSKVARTSRPGVQPMDRLHELVPLADVVVLAVPLTSETHHLVDARFLASMRDRCVLVNVSRGGLVDTDALVAELSSGRLRAVLDVTDPEPLPASHPLWRAPNVMITPHAGGGAPGWSAAGIELVRGQVRRHLAGEPLVNIVDRTGRDF